MRVSLIFPKYGQVYEEFEVFFKVAKFFRSPPPLPRPAPPLGLLYLSSSLELRGHTVQVIDQHSEDLTDEEVVKRIKSFGADFVGIHVTSATFQSARKLAMEIKKKTGLPIAIGGPHVSIERKKSLEEFKPADFAFEKDSEITFGTFIDKFELGKDFKDIPGIFFRSNGEVLNTPPNNLDYDFDGIPFPDRSKLPFENYKEFVPNHGIKIVSAFQTIRGCPFNCIFCSERVIYPKVKFRSVENVIKELKEIREKTPIRHLYFVDDTLTLLRKRSMEIFKLMEEEKLGFTFWGSTVASMIDERLAEQMVRAGLTSVYFGIESGDPEILKIVKKPANLDQVKRAVKIMNSLGVEVLGGIVLGLPYETKRKAWSSIKFVWSLKEIDMCGIFLGVPEPGTEYWEMVQRGEGGIKAIGNLQNLHRGVRYSSYVEVNDINGRSLVFMQKIGLILFYLSPSRVIRLIRRYGFRFLLIFVLGFVLSQQKSFKKKLLKLFHLRR